MVTSNFPRWRGDATTPFVLHLAQDLQALGWEIQVLAPHAPGAARSEVLDGVPVQRFRYFRPERQQTVCYNGGALGNLRRQPLNFLKLPFLVAAEWAAVRRELRRGHFDLVHSHWLVPQGFVCSQVARGLRVPHVATIHGGDVFALRHPLLDVFRRRALAGADCVTVNSSATRQSIEALAPGLKTVVRVPMGATEPSPDPGRSEQIRTAHREAGGPLMLFVGRLVEEKGVGDAIAALPAILESRPGARLLVIGEGPDKPRFEEAARARGVASRVVFAGWVDSRALADYYRAADVFVGPSKRAANGWVEAQGLTFAEALLAGLPVVATASGGIVDQIRDGETGLLVPEGSAAAIAAAVLRLANDAALAGRLAAQGQAFARQELTRTASAQAFTRAFESVRRPTSA